MVTTIDEAQRSDDAATALFPDCERASGPNREGELLIFLLTVLRAA
jgi:hypothetical protein